MHAACMQHVCMLRFMYAARAEPLGSGGFHRHFRIRYSRRTLLLSGLSWAVVVVLYFVSCRPCCERERERPRHRCLHPARPARTSQHMAAAQVLLRDMVATVSRSRPPFRRCPHLCTPAAACTAAAAAAWHQPLRWRRSSRRLLHPRRPAICPRIPPRCRPACQATTVPTVVPSLLLHTPRYAHESNLPPVLPLVALRRATLKPRTRSSRCTSHRA